MLRAGLIGMGRMGITHFSLLNTHPAVKIVSVCDQSRTMLSLFRRYTGVNIFRDYREMIKEGGLDFVVISTPADSHAEVISAAIQSGLHVFTEKPFVMNVAEGEKILLMLKEKPVVNQVGYVNRFNEVFQEVKRLLDLNTIGTIRHIKLEMFGNTITREVKSGWRTQRTLGGGCMYEFASHCIDLANYFVGRPDSITGSVLQSVYSADAEDIVTATFIYKRGCTGTLIVNWSDVSVRKPVNRVEIIGDMGKIIADKHAYKIYLKKADPSSGFHAGWNTRNITEFSRGVHFYIRGNEFSSQLAYFVSAIEGKHPVNISSFEEAMKTDYIIHDIFLHHQQVRRNG